MSDAENQRPIELSDIALSDLADLLQHIERVPAISACVAAEKPAATLVGLSHRVAKKLGSTNRAVVDVLYGLVTIARMRHFRKVDSERIVALLTASLEQADDDWKKEYLDKWQASRSVLVAAIDPIGESHPTVISQKAQILAYSHQNILISSRLITDVRPVFDSEATKIVETVITHSLNIQYTDGSQKTSVACFALDATDVADLRRACERAEAKAKVTKDSLSALNPVILPENDAE